jgi:hypothetical protein
MALGAYVSALVAEMRTARPRATPLTSGARYLEHPLPPDLHAWIDAVTIHDTRLTVGDLVIKDLGGDVPIPNTTDWDLRSDVLCIAQTSGGDLWVVPHPSIIGARPATPVARIRHDFDWTEYAYAPSLDAFVEGMVAEARDRTYRNDIAKRLGKRRITSARVAR